MHTFTFRLVTLGKETLNKRLNRQTSATTKAHAHGAVRTLQTAVLLVWVPAPSQERKGLAPRLLYCHSKKTAINQSHMFENPSLVHAG